MKNILLIGVGGTGSSAVDILYSKIREFGNMTDNKISAVVFDTDEGAIDTISAATVVSMADTAGIGAVCNRLGNDLLREWFPVDVEGVREQELVNGASQWRKKSYLAFLNAMNKPANYSKFTRALEDLTIDKKGKIEIYVIASVAGGTGSGSFIPIALFAKQFLKAAGRDPIVNAAIALPDIYSDVLNADNRVKVYANAYAILRELNAINQVAYGYNREVEDYNSNSHHMKKSPIKLKIGNEKAKSEKNQKVGLLFDASDRDFWTPAARPFDQVFVLDRVPGIHSVHAHDIILADSLYTVLCTNIGAEMNSALSNQATLINQNNGTNAIYAGISTARLRFPLESILDYVAHEKTLRVCNEEWLALHKATEDVIKEREQRARDCQRRFTLGDGDYAAFLIGELDKQRKLRIGSAFQTVDRTTAKQDSEGNRLEGNTADDYFKRLNTAIDDMVSGDTAIALGVWENRLTALHIKERPGYFARKELKATVFRKRDTLGSELARYYNACYSFVQDNATSVVDAVLTFKEKKDLSANKTFSLLENLLKRDGKYLHPVTAMVQLCRMKTHVVKYLKQYAVEWNESTVGKGEIPDSCYRSDGRLEKTGAVKFASEFALAKSYYAKMHDRFKAMATAKDAYLKAKTDAYTDNALMVQDAVSTLRQIQTETATQLRIRVYRTLTHYLDLLINEYRKFFANFEEAKEDLVVETDASFRKDCGRVDSVLNVFSYPEEKKLLLSDILDDVRETEEDVDNNDSVAGESVFLRCFGEAAAIETGDRDRASKGVTFTGLFSGMVKSYAQTIALRSDSYQKLKKLDIFRAIRESCKRSGRSESYLRVLNDYLSTAVELARPSLIIDQSKREEDLPDPCDVMVVMISERTAANLLSDASQYNVSVPADGVKSHILISVADQVVKKFAGDDSVRVMVVNGISDDVVYITGERMNITPLRMPKLDELSRDPVYFNYYRRALKNAERYDTDMWNPHIAYNLEKRGYLPYMNPGMEEICDEKLFKALFYGIQKNRIVYKRASATLKAASFRCTVNGDEPIRGSDGKLVTMKNLAQLIAWLRNRDELVEDWSLAFDKWLAEQKSSLPNMVVESQRATLEAAITKSDFIRMLRNSFLTTSGKSVNLTASKEDAVGGMGILEFAWLIKNSEETMRDCDDAERILKVAYKIFYDFCAYKVKPRVNPVAFAEVYMQQLNELFYALANGSRVNAIKKSSKRSGGNAATEYFDAIVTWINETGNFRAVPNAVFDEYGNVDVSARYEKTSKIISALESEAKATDGDMPELDVDTEEEE